MPAETHSHHLPLGADEVTALVRERVAESLRVDDAALAPGARLRADLGADDLGLLDLVDVLEEDLGERTVGFTIDETELGDIETVDDLVDLVLATLGLVPGGGS